MTQFAPKVGVIAAGHAQTAEAGRLILETGGNAFDAAIASVLAACVVESTLTSLGGGGFLLGKAGEQPAILWDFFCQTPRQRPSLSEVEFYPVTLDFGGAKQTFHIGRGAIALPGMVAGLFTVHRQWGTLPFSRLIEPAVQYAEQGFEVNHFNAFTYRLLAPILQQEAEAAAHYAPNGQLLQTGMQARLPQLATVLTDLARYGEDWFYRGEFAHWALQSLAGGSCLTENDWADYQVIPRTPLSIKYRGRQVLTNPPPSSGGLLIGFALELLEQFSVSRYPLGSVEQIQLLAQVMVVTSQARQEKVDGSLFNPNLLSTLFNPQTMTQYQTQLQQRLRNALGTAGEFPLNKLGSTTHISVLDADGNAVSFTSSNGEGSSHVVPGTGVMLNNMLGEADLNPRGFYHWQPNQRLASMMSPSLILDAEQRKAQIVLGSGGSNRIRSAILQVIGHCLDYDLSLPAAIAQPRLHWERQQLDLEPSLHPLDSKQLQITEETQVTQWQEQNMFFGGVHAVAVTEAGELIGAGDERRAGAVAISRG